MNTPPITNIEQFRQQEIERAKSDLLSRGIRLDSQEASDAIAAASDGATDRAWDYAYQMSLKGILAKGMKGVYFVENEADAASLGGAYQLDHGGDEQDRVNADEFARLRADQFTKGLKPIKWDEWKQAQDRGVAKPVIDSFIGNALVGLEGMAGSLAAGGYSLWDTYGPNGAMWDSEGGSARVMQQMAGMKQAQQIGAEFARGMILEKGLSQDYAEEIAGPVGKPVMASERVGPPAIEIGGVFRAGAFLTEEAGNVGQALASIPMSVPSMLAPNKAVRAIAMAPFGISAYGSAKQERWSIYEEQAALAEQLGIEPPPVPTLGELETWGGIHAAFEVGSEFAGDTAQVGLIKFGLGKGNAKIRRGPQSVRDLLNGLADSMNRRRGLLGVAKGATAVVGGGLTEGAEEVGALVGTQVAEGVEYAKNALFERNNDFWTVDSKFFDAEAGPTGLYLADDVRHSFKVGSYAGILMGGGAQAAGSVPKAARFLRDRAEVKRGTGFVTEAMMMAQESDAKQRLLSQSVQTSGTTVTRKATEAWQRNAMPTRGSVMAMAHVEEMANGNRMVMFVDQADVDVTLTPEVKERMERVGISTKHIGVVNGKRVYAPVGAVQQAEDSINQGEISDLVGSPFNNSGNLLAGMAVLKNAAGQIVEYYPYSNPSDMTAAEPEIRETARRRGLTLSIVNDGSRERFADIEAQLRRQMDADAVAAGKPLKEQKALPRGQKSRGIRALRTDVQAGAARSGKKSDPFSSPYLTKDEIGDATNGDVRVTVSLSEVAPDAMSDGERNLIRSTGQQATILDGKVVFSIKQKDGTVKTIEKAPMMDGAYVSQASPDGVFLVRENGTAMTARSAFAISMHETRHRTLSRSPAGARFLARLLQIDPVYAMRGGASYMRRFGAANGITALEGMNDAQVIAYYRGLHEAANALLAGVATTEQQQQVEQAGGYDAARSQVRRFSEESVTTTANRAMGQATQMAAEWDGIYKDAQERSLRSFTRWMANVLVRNGFAGPEAQQALYEIQQRLRGVREEEIKIHRRFSDRVSESVKKDMDEIARKEAARATMQQAGVATAPAPSATPSTGVSTPPAPPAPPAGGVSPSLRDGAGGIPVAPVGGDDDKRKISNAISTIESMTADPQASGLAASALGALAEVVPYLTSTLAQVSSGVTAPQRAPLGRRQIPEQMRDVAQPAAQPVSETAQQIEDTARRQRNAQQAMAIIRGEAPTEPVDLGTVARIERARSLYQTPEEEISYSLPDRPGRQAPNEDIRSLRNEFMRSRGIEPEQRIEDTYPQIDEEFAKKVADWLENTPVNYEDPEMLRAYDQFAQETVDQYEFLREQGYEMIPWAGKGEPYANSADMVDDVRKNKRIFYYKSVNPEESSSFGSDPAAMQELLQRNPLLREAGGTVDDSNGDPYTQTVNDIFRAVHDIFGHAAEGYQFGPRGEEGAYRSHAVMFSPLARRAMGTETRAQNSWVNYGPNRRNPDGSVWGERDPRYKKWLAGFKEGKNFGPQKPLAMPDELLSLYSQREGDQAQMSLRPVAQEDMTPTMKVWSRGSKVVDESGSLIPMYHGTDADFDTFRASEGGSYGPGIYLATDSGRAGRYAGEGFGSKVIPLVANIKNPLVVDAGIGEQYIRKALDVLGKEFNDFQQDEYGDINPAVHQALRDAGFDGVHVKAEDGYDAIGRSRGDFWVAFDPNQVKGYFNANPSASDNRMMYSQRAETPAQKARKTSAAQRRQEAKIAREKAAAQKKAAEKRGKIVRKVAQTGAAPAISVSTAPTAAPMINPNIIVGSVSNDPEFSQDKAYQRAHERILDTATSNEFALKVVSLLDTIPGISPLASKNIKTILGNYNGVTERTMRIEIPGLSHEQSVQVANLIGSLLLQEAVIVTSEATEGTARAEQGHAVAFLKEDGSALDQKVLAEVLSDAGFGLGGASEIPGNAGVVSVFTNRPNNPVTKAQFVRTASDIAKKHGLVIEEAKVRSTYSKIGDADVLGRKRSRNGKVRKVLDAESIVAAWSPWIDAAAVVVEEYRDEGFDINIEGWVGEVAGSEAAPVVDELVRRLAERAARNANGLDARLNQRYAGNIQNIEPGAKIPAKTNKDNYGASVNALDAILERNPKPFESVESASRFFVDLFGSRTIPLLPTAFIESVRNGFERMKRDLSLIEDGGRLTMKMVDEAIHGMEMAAKLRALYAAGKALPKHTVALAMWGFMSRGVSPQIQESLFLDLVNYTNKSGRGLGYFVDIAMSGAWSTTVHNKEWENWVSEMFEELAFVDIDALINPETGELSEKNGSPGSGAKHNANAFGRNFLANISRVVTVGGVTLSGLQHFHNAMADPKVTGRALRRIFNALGGSLGIDNKVVGFAALVAGKDDISVNDRVRINDHYNRDGRIPNIYDGFTSGYEILREGQVVGETYIPAQFPTDLSSREEYEAYYEQEQAKAEASVKNLLAKDPEAAAAEFAAATAEAKRKASVIRKIKKDTKAPAEIRQRLIEQENADIPIPDLEQIDDKKKRLAILNAAIKRWAKSSIEIVPIKVAGLATLFNGVRGLALYEAAENTINPAEVFSTLAKKRPDILKYISHGLEHWMNWVGASGQEASHKTLDGLIEMINNGQSQIADIFAKEGRYDTYMYGSEYGYVRDESGRLKPEYRYTVKDKTYRFEPKKWAEFITSVVGFDYAADYNAKEKARAKAAKLPAPKAVKFSVTKDSSTGQERKTPWTQDALVGQNGLDAIEKFAQQFSSGTVMSLREDPLAFTNAYKNALILSGGEPRLGETEEQMMDRAISENPKIRGRIEMLRLFAARNIAPTSHDEFHEAWKRMVKGRWAKPSHPNFVKYWDKDNALNGLQPNDIWWHGSGAEYTTPDPNKRSMSQFGWHCGNFYQASNFVNPETLVGNRRTPVMYPCYVRASKPMEIDDRWSWYLEEVVNSMIRFEHIDEAVASEFLARMYGELGIESFHIPSLVENGVRGIVPRWVVGNIVKPTDPSPAVLNDSSIRAAMAREFIESLGFDAIRYQNAAEGKNASPFMVTSAEYASRNTAKSNPTEDPAEIRSRSDLSDEQKELLVDRALRKKRFAEWSSRNAGATEREKLAAQKEIQGDRSSLIIWKSGQVKSASATDVGFDTKNMDILASLRIEPPSVVTAYSHIWSDNVPAMMSMREGVQGVRDEFVLNRIDKYDELRRYGEQFERASGLALPDLANPYLGARTLTGRLGAVQRQAEFEYSSILRDMAENGIEMEDMDEFLIAQHAINGGNAYIATINPAMPDGGTGMTTADANTVISRHLASGQFATMNRIADDWRQMLRAGLLLRRDSGLITHEMYNTLTTRYSHYVPLRGAPGRPFDENFEDWDSGEVFGRGLSTQGRGMPNRLGRRSMAEGVTSQVGMVHEDTISRVARNEVAQRFLRLTLMVNDPGMAEVVRPMVRQIRPVYGMAPGGGRIRLREEVQEVLDPNWTSDPRNFGVYVDAPITINGHDYEHGSLVIIRINNRRLADAISTPDPSLTAFEETLRFTNNAFRFVTTGLANPAFAPVNAVRDLTGGALNNVAMRGLADTTQMLRRYPRAFRQVFRQAWLNPQNPTGSYRRFIDAGGDQVYWRPNDLEAKQTDFDALYERVLRRDPNDRSLARTILGWYGAFFSAAETATRLAQFEQRMATGSTPEQAALAARDITVDFAKGGKRKSRMNAWYVFINASIQGSVNVGRSVLRNGAMAPALITFGMATAMLGRALGGDDEETGLSRWDLIPDYVKASSIVIMDPTGSGRYMAIPMPYGFNVFASAGQRIADAAFGPDTAGDAAAGVVVDALNAFNPLGGSGVKDGIGSIVSAFIPTMARPAVEIAQNRNWMGRPIYPSVVGRQKKTDAYSYFDRTPEGYINAAQAWNKLGGGDMFDAGGGGYMDISPNTLQYLVGYYLSGFGRNVDRLYNLATTNEPIEPNDIPLVRSFFGNAATDTRAVMERYDAVASSALPELYRAEALGSGTVDPETREELLSRPRDEARLQTAVEVQRSEDELRKIRKALKTATPEQRERLIEARTKAMKRAIKASNELTGGG